MPKTHGFFALLVIRVPMELKTFLYIKKENFVVVFTNQIKNFQGLSINVNRCGVGGVC